MVTHMNKIKNAFWKVVRFIDLLTGDNVSVYAAQASFFLIISVIPFLMLCFNIIKLFIVIDEQAIIHTINSFAPAQVSMLITTVVNELFSRASSASLISITAITTLWLSSRGIMSLYTGLNSVYNLPTRNYFYSRFIAIIYTLAFLAGLILTIIVFGFGSKLESILTGHFAFLSNIIWILMKLRIVIFIILLTLIFALAYKVLPKRNSKFKQQIPGAFVAAVGWIGFSFIYSIYIDNFSNYSYVYGSLAAAVFLMLWVYFCMNIFLYGAQINKMLEFGYFTKKTTL